jgi:putative ABC transport system ATP-binding protein
MDALKIQDLYKIYKQGDIETVALRGASLTVRSGEFVAIAGRSGAGKSTLLNIIGGLTLPSAGQVIVGGIDISRLSEGPRAAFRRKHIGVIFQTDNLIPFLTTFENIMLPMQLSGQIDCGHKAHALLKEVGLQERSRHKPGMLSGGERQRVAIAVALANRPDLLLADELTGEFDTVTSELVMDLLSKLNSARGLTLIVVTHNKTIAGLAPRQVTIADGLLTEGTRICMTSSYKPTA